MSAEPPSTNPYEPPQVASRRIPLSSGQREFLLAISLHQKGILICLLLRGLLEFSFLYYYERYLRAILISEGILMIATAFFVSMIGVRLYGRFSGLYYGFVSLTPFLGVFVLWTVNHAATLVLRHFGIHVGWLGADRSEI
jgi:hypothetical protein